MKNEKVLITGVAGFIGSHIADHCINLGMDVIGMDDMSGGFLENIPSKVNFIEGSITDNVLIEKIFTEHQFDYIYHLGAYAAEGLSHFIRRFNYQNNLIGSINLINQSIKQRIKCFVFTSSIAVYGANQTPMTEALVPLPEDPYGISKYAIELDLAAAHKMFGLPYIIFRPHNVYGERQNIADKYRNVIGIFMNQVMKGEPMTIFGDGHQTRAFSHIDNVAPLISESPRIKAAYNQVYNIGADKPYSVLELANLIAQTFGVKPNIKHLDARNEVVHAFASHKKLYKVFNRTGNPVSLKEGIQRMAAWVKERGPMTPVTFDNIEITLNLPPSWR